MQKILITLILSTFILGGCAHKIEIQQGNVVTQAQLEKLQPGLDKRQVRSLLGSPLLIDTFHPERWDYYYSKSQGSELKERYQLRLFFSENKLLRFEKTGTLPENEYQEPSKPKRYFWGLL